MKKILITGGSGQLAQSFKSLFSNTYDLLAINSKSLDITNANNVKHILDKEKPDIIINCAAMTNVDGCENQIEKAYLVNGLAIKNFVDYFEGLFIQISTDYIFDGENGPYSERSKPNPLSIYGKSKLLGEEIVKKNFQNHLIIRTNVLFDLNTKASFLDWIIQSLSKNKKINIVNDQINNPVWTNDLSKTISFLINHNLKGVFHVGSDTLCSRYEFARMIGKEWNLDLANLTPISTDELFAQLDSYIAERPLNSGLVTEFEGMPNISLVNALINLKENN